MTRDNVLEGDTGASLLSRQLGRIVESRLHRCASKCPPTSPPTSRKLVVRVDDTDAAGGAGLPGNSAYLRRDPATWMSPVVVTWPPTRHGRRPVAPIHWTTRWGSLRPAADPIEALQPVDRPTTARAATASADAAQTATRAVSVPERNQPWPYAHRLRRAGHPTVWCGECWGRSSCANCEAAGYHQVGPVPDRPAYRIGHPGTEEPAHGAVRRPPEGSSTGCSSSCSACSGRIGARALAGYRGGADHFTHFFANWLATLLSRRPGERA